MTEDRHFKWLSEPLCICLYCNDDHFYGILCYDEYREFTGIMGDIRVFWL